MKRKIVLLLMIFTVGIVSARAQTGTQMMYHVAGNGTNGYAGDGGLASAGSVELGVTPAGDDNSIAIDGSHNVYIADNTNSIIRKVDGSTGNISTFVSSMSNVEGMTCDNGGNLYVVDNSANLVKIITPGGTVTTFAGGGSSYSSGVSPTSVSLTGIHGIAHAAISGTEYIYVQLGTIISRIDLGSSPTITTVASYPGGQGFTVDNSGNIFFLALVYDFSTFTFNNDLIELPVSSSITNLGHCGINATSIEIDNSGNVVVCGIGGMLYSKPIASFATASPVNYCAGYGYSGDCGAASAAYINNTYNIAIDVSDIYFSENTGNRVRKVSNNNIPSIAATSISVCENSIATSIGGSLGFTDVEQCQTETLSVTTTTTTHGGTIGGFPYSVACTGSTMYPSGITYTPATGFSGTDDFVITISDGVDSRNVTVYVTVNPLPNTGIISGSGAVCVGSSITLTESVTGGSWSSSSGNATVTPGGVVTGVTAGTIPVTISYIVTNSCGTATTTHNVTVTTASSYSISINMTGPSPWNLLGDDAYTVCNGSITLSAIGSPTIPSGATYNWHLVGSTYSLGTGSSISLTSLTTSADYQVDITYGCTYSKAVRVIVPANGTCSPCNYYTVNTARGYDGTPTVSTSTCPDCSTVQPFHTIYSTTMAPVSGTSSVPVNYYIATPPTGLEVKFPIGVNNISNDIFYVDGGVNLAVGSGDDITSDLTIDHCHFFGSEACPWNGIKVYIVNNGTLSGTNKLKVKNNTLIENCATAAAATPLSGWGTQFPTAAIYNFGGNVSGVVTSTSLTMSTSPLPSGYTDATPELNCMINCSNVIFNRNDCGITISNYLLEGPSGSYTPPQTFPFNITNNVFTSRRLSKFSLSASAASSTDYYPFSWPSEVNLATQTSTDPYLPAFGVDNYAVANPRTATTQNMGIHLINVNVKHPNTNKIDPYITYGVKIGNYDSTNNLFDTLYAGITITNSNAFMYNNVFKRLFNLGINTLNDSKYSTKIEGTNLTNGNRFYNVRGTSIYFGSPSYDFSAKYCTIESEIVTTASTVTGFSIANLTSYKNINIENNTIYSIPLPVNISVSDPTASTSTVGNILIKNNLMYDIFPGSTPTGSSLRYIREPISVRNNRAYSVTGTILSGAGLNIENNTLANALRGVFVGTGTSGTTGFREYPVIINNNVISLKTGATPSYGILSRKNYHTGDQIDGNSITGPGYSTASFTGVSCDGIGVSSSSRTDISCNYVGDINTGFYFTGTNHVDWKKNVMEKNKYGLYLSGQIDNQGGNSPCDPIDNYWAWSSTSSNWWATTSGVYHTFTTINPTSSVLNVRNVLTGSTSGSQYSPFNNSNSGGTAYSTGASTIVDLSSCSGLPAAPSICAPIPTGFSAKGEVLLSESTSTQSYTLYPNPTTGSITIAQSEVVDGAVTAKVINIVGATIYEGSLNFTGGQSQLTLPDVASGIYLVELKDAAGHRFTSKVIVQR